MRIIAYDRFKPGVTMETIEPYLPEEVANVWRLWKAGVVPKNYARADEPGVVIVFELDSVERPSATPTTSADQGRLPRVVLHSADDSAPDRESLQERRRPGRTVRPNDRGLELGRRQHQIGGRVERYHQIEIPKTLEDGDPARLALIVYDMQVGVVRQLDDGLEVTARVVHVLDAARRQASASTSPAT